MSSSITLILSMIFFMCFLLLGGDMLCLSSAYSDLDSTAISLGYVIAKAANTDEPFLHMLEERYNVTFESISPKSPQVGETVEFTIYRYYDPLIISNSDFKISARRTTVLGYYG